MQARNPRILFVSAADNCAAQIAERYAHKFGKGEIDARSAYLEDTCQNANMLLALVEDGVDFDAKGTRLLSDKDLDWADLLVVIGDLPPLNLPDRYAHLPISHWNMVDELKVAIRPDNELEFFRQTRDGIKLWINSMLGEFSLVPRIAL